MTYVMKRPRCSRCGVRHRTWRMRARCQLWPLLWVSGNPPLRGPCWASVSDCNSFFIGRGRTVQLYGSKAKALAAKRMIDEGGCGGRCCRMHRLVELRP